MPNRSVAEGEHTAKLLQFPVIARRPDFTPEEILSREQLQQLRKNLSLMQPGIVREFFEKSYRDCRPLYNQIPTPKQIQVFVQAWKQLRKWRTPALTARASGHCSCTVIYSHSPESVRLPCPLTTGIMPKKTLTLHSEPRLQGA